MLNTSKCPHCDKILSGVEVEDVVLNVNFAPEWKGFSYCCPYCRKILGVQMNPLTLDSDLENTVRAELSALRNDLKAEMRRLLLRR